MVYLIFSGPQREARPVKFRKALVVFAGIIFVLFGLAYIPELKAEVNDIRNGSKRFHECMEQLEKYDAEFFLIIGLERGYKDPLRVYQRQRRLLTVPMGWGIFSS